MKKTDLINGSIYTLSNDHSQNDDLREAEVSFNKKIGKFIIWFNGQLIHSCKTFQALEKRLEKLIVKWNLK